VINSELFKFDEIMKGVKTCNTPIVQFTKFNYSFNLQKRCQIKIEFGWTNLGGSIVDEDGCLWMNSVWLN